MRSEDIGRVSHIYCKLSKAKESIEYLKEQHDREIDMEKLFPRFPLSDIETAFEISTPGFFTAIFRVALIKELEKKIEVFEKQLEEYGVEL